MYINENKFFYSWNIQEKLNEHKKKCIQYVPSPYNRGLTRYQTQHF
jgi:hypothetical protein